MPEIDINSDNGKNLWSNLLQDVKDKSSKTANIPKSLLVLGNEGSGKSSLIARLQKLDTKHGVALEFDYIEIKDEFTEENKKLNIWIGSGDTYHTNLLKYALNENNFGYSLCMITVSFSEPWALLDNLEEWLHILKMHINRLKLNSEDEKFFKDSLIHQFQEYSEPDLTNEMLLVGKRRDTDYNYLHPCVVEDPDKVLIPLEEEVFTKNMGIPIIVVITKTDNIFNLEQDYDYNDDKFDFIQMHLRRICLKYGAALCYTSLKDDRNCDLLLNYLLHRFYGFSMRYNASVIEKDTIFIPSGWDSNKKIDILSENLFDDIRNQSYNSLISKPLSIVRANAQNRLTEPDVAEDEQIFLMRQQALIQRLKSASSAEGNIKDIPRTTTSMTSSSSNRRGKNSPGISGSVGGTGTGSQQANEGVLANFFSSLLNKRGTSTGSPLSSQQTSVVESPRGEDSISETDDYQKDEISNSLCSNTDSTQQRIVEVKESINQGKIVAPSNINKLAITTKIGEDADITNVKHQISVENLVELNFHENQTDLNNSTLGQCITDCNLETSFVTENSSESELNNSKKDNCDISTTSFKEETRNSLTMERLDNEKVGDEEETVDQTNTYKTEDKSIKDVENVTNIPENEIIKNIPTTENKNDSINIEVENISLGETENIEDKVKHHIPEQTENLKEFEVQGDTENISEEHEKELEEPIEKSNDIGNIITNQSDEIMEEVQSEEITNSEINIIESTELIETVENIVNYHQVIAKDMDDIKIIEVNVTKSTDENECVKNITDDNNINIVNCKNDIQTEEIKDTDKVAVKEAEDIHMVDNVNVVRKIDDVERTVEPNNQPAEEIINIENIMENQFNEKLDVEELEVERSEKAEIIYDSENESMKDMESDKSIFESQLIPNVHTSVEENKDVQSNEIINIDSQTEIRDEMESAKNDIDKFDNTNVQSDNDECLLAPIDDDAQKQS